MSEGKNLEENERGCSNSFRHAYVITREIDSWPVVKQDILEAKDLGYAIAVKVDKSTIITYIQFKKRKYLNRGFFAFSEIRRCTGRSYECKERLTKKVEDKNDIIWTWGDFNIYLGGKPFKLSNFEEEASDEKSTLWEKEYPNGKINRIIKNGGKWYVDFRRRKGKELAKRGNCYRLHLFLEMAKDIFDAARETGFNFEKYKIEDINISN